MDLSNDKQNVKITSIVFLSLSIVEFIVARSYLAITPWLLILATIGLVIYANFKSKPKTHLRVLILLIVNHLLFSITIMINFSELPIAFNNTSQIVFTIGMNIFWLCLYIAVMYKKEIEDLKYVFYIVTVVLMMFKSFSNSVRIIAVVRGYLPGALSAFGGILLVLLIILLTISQFAFLFAYLYKVNHELDLSIEKTKLKKLFKNKR